MGRGRKDNRADRCVLCSVQVVDGTYANKIRIERGLRENGVDRDKTARWGRKVQL